MFRAFALFLFMAGHAIGQDKPLLYNKVDGGDTPLDRAVKKAYESKFTIKDVSVSEDYVSPKPTAGSLPKDARDAEGNSLEGYVLVAYIVTAEGLAQEPVVLDSSNEALNRAALSAMKEWRFTPGSVRGKPVATTAAQEFVFKVEQSGFETTNIVLYQPDDVLKKRLPGAGHLAAYIQKIQATVTEEFAKSTKPDALQVVVAVRPEGESRVWFNGSLREAKALEALGKKIEAIPPVAVHDGPVAFAICGTIAGGKDNSQHPPMPAQWQEALKLLPRGTIIPDGVLNSVWPEEPQE